MSSAPHASPSHWPLASRSPAATPSTSCCIRRRTSSSRRPARATRAKPDFAAVEHDFPLSTAELAKLTPDNIVNYSQEQLDQIYARLTAGPIPDGPFDGNLVFPMGASGDRRLAEIVGGLPGFAVELKLHRVEDARAPAVERQGVLPRRPTAAQSHRRPHGPEADRRRPATRWRRSRSTARTSGCSSRRGCTAGRACSTAAASRSSSTTSSPTTCPATARSPTSSPAGTASRCATRSAWSGPASTSAAPTSGRVFLLNFTLYNKDVAERDGAAFQKTGTVKEDCWPGTQARQVVATQVRHDARRGHGDDRDCPARVPGRAARRGRAGVGREPRRARARCAAGGALAVRLRGHARSRRKARL